MNRCFRFLKFAWLTSLACTIPSTTSHAQDAETREAIKRKGWAERDMPAHAHKSDGSCCQPCVPTEAELNEDVFRRPCFVRYLSRSRELGRRAYRGLTGDALRDGIPISNELVPLSVQVQFTTMIEEVLKPSFLYPPSQPPVLIALGDCPLVNITELRNGVPTAVGTDNDCSVELKEFKDRDALQTGWSVGSIDILPRSSFSGAHGRLNGITIRLRIHGAQRLELRPRPVDFVRSGPLADNFRDFFDREAFHNLLTQVFRVPYRSADEYTVDGFDTSYVDVRAFHGRLFSIERAAEWRKDRAGIEPPQHWWEEMILFMTDTDPQYFCLTIPVSRNDSSR